jgi:hypothetical protein
MILDGRTIKLKERDARHWLVDRLLAAHEVCAPPEAVQRAFLANGLVNALDGSEEHLVKVKRLFR